MKILELDNYRPQKWKPEGNDTVDIEIVRYIRTHCQEWLSAAGNFPVYRGVLNTTEIYYIKPIRPDRKPLHSSLESHNMLNQLIAAANLIANRSNAIFVSGNIDIASHYASDTQLDIEGAVYTVFPIGEFNYTWSPRFNDLFFDVVNILQLKDLSGDDGSLDKAITSGHEIMINAGSAFYIEHEYFLKEIAPLLYSYVK